MKIEIGQNLLKSMRFLAIVPLALLGLAMATPARADNVDNVTLNFQSGAQFVGTVDFANDYSYVIGVSGMLSGYQVGTTGYQGSGSDSIDWVWGPIGTNYSPGNGDVFATWLLDGTPSNWFNFIGFEYDYTNAPVLITANNPFVDNSSFEIDDSDALVSGTIYYAYSTSATPEPGTWLLIGSGMLGLLGLARKRIGVVL